MSLLPADLDDGARLRESVPSAREAVRIYVIGVFMGAADGVPGVSGGTIALIAGVYERLVGAINEVSLPRFVAGVAALVPLGGVAVDDALDVWETVDGWFLVALMAGVATAVVVVTRAVDFLAEHYPVALFGFFFGLIAASALVLFRGLSIDRPRTAAAAVAGFVIAFVVSGLSEAFAGGGLLVVFVAGAVAVSAMILPGISGSLLLVILSQYRRMTDALSGFVDGLAALAVGDPAPGLLQDGQTVVVFVLGGLVGLFSIARLIKWALDADRKATFAFLVALVVGALRAPVATLNGPDYAVAWTTPTLATFAVAAVAGAVLVLVLDRFAVDIDPEAF